MNNEDDDPSNSVSMQRNDAGETPADVLRARIRRLCEAEGVPFEDLPPEEFTDDLVRPLSVADILRRPWRSGPQVQIRHLQGL
jgi:hypothetical protein